MFLAGRETEARPWLEDFAKICTVPFLSTRTWARTVLYLGETDENAGQKDSACASYAKVLERWGHAKPRSVTADEARAHAKALGCGL
jgi:serine/threonine-protein kinase